MYNVLCDIVAIYDDIVLYDLWNDDRFIWGF